MSRVCGVSVLDPWWASREFVVSGRCNQLYLLRKIHPKVESEESV